MDDDKALLWDKSRRKRDFGESSKEEDIKKMAREELNIEKHTYMSDEAEGVEDKDADLKEKLKMLVDNENNYTNEEIHAELKTIDPVMAARLHPNNRRKVLRYVS